MKKALWENNEPQLICTVSNGAEVRGYVVIDSIIGGHSLGGLRMLPDVGEAEVRALAHTMTLKYGFLGLPHGGAKAGVRCDPEAPQAEREQNLTEFARAIAPLLRSRTYIPGSDMGTTNDDIRHLLKAANVRIKRRELRSTRSGYYTALTVFTGVKQATRHLGLALSECRIAIEGFGKVGGALMDLLIAAGARVVAISTSKGAIFNPKGLDGNRLRVLASSAGSEIVDRYSEAERLESAELLELPVDVLCPCARHNSVHTDNVPRIAARIICPGANNSITPEAEYVLFNRGVLSLPDFVTNCGGVLGGTMEFASLSEEKIASFIDRYIGQRITWILSEAERKHLPPREIAIPLALRRFRQMQRNSVHHTLRRHLFEAGLEFYRRGWIPGFLVAALSQSYFKRTLAQD
jgi:glutamate dehydrogenase/leucine dehydrogenase